MKRQLHPEQSGSNWYRLDNAAKIFPVIMRSRHVSVFRLAAVLHDPVDPEVLQIALEKTLRRFPYFAVRLKRGLFWYYLESFSGRPLIEPDVQNPMRPWSTRDEKDFLFRVRYGEHRIAVEFFHALTDGYGASVFIKTLAAVYLGLQGIRVEAANGVLAVDDPPDAAEMEDAYNRFSDFRAFRRPRQTRAFHLQGAVSQGHHMQIICGVIPVDAVMAAARRFQISITELLVGTYLYQLYLIQQQGGYRIQDPVRVSVPINVRRYYSTKTLRNFALYANPGIEPALGIYTQEEIFGLVHHFLRYTVNEKYLNALMCANVRPEKNILLRLSPLILKNMVMRLVYSLTGESRFTSTLSNLGVVDMPDGLAQHIERLEFLLGPSRLNPVNCAVISAGSSLVINFTSTMEETDLQRAFFKQLIHLGIPVRVESNQVYKE